MQVSLVFTWLMSFIIADRNQISVDEAGNINVVSSFATINQVSGQPQGTDLLQVVQQMSEIVQKIRKEHQDVIKGSVMASLMQRKATEDPSPTTNPMDQHISDMNGKVGEMTGELQKYNETMTGYLQSLEASISRAAETASNQSTTITMLQTQNAECQNNLTTRNRELEDMTAANTTCHADLGTTRADLFDVRGKHTTFCNAVKSQPWTGFLSENFKAWIETGAAAMTLPDTFSQSCTETASLECFTQGAGYCP